MNARVRMMAEMTPLLRLALGGWLLLIAVNTAHAPGRWPGWAELHALFVPMAGHFDAGMLSMNWGVRALAAAVAASVAAGMAGAGAMTARWLRIPRRPLIAWLIGFGALPPVLLGFGLAGLFRRPVLAGAIVLTALPLLRVRLRVPLRSPGWPAALAPCLLALPGALMPETVFDALRYHLALPARYLAEGRIVHLDRFLFGSFPQGAELLYGTAAAFGTTVAAKLLAWTAFAAATTLIHARLAAILPRRTATLCTWGCSAMPFLSIHATTAGTDLPLIALETAAFLAILESFDVPRKTSKYRLAAVLFGAALGIKHLAALAIIATAVPLIAMHLRQPLIGRNSSRTALPLLPILLFLPSVWLCKNFFLTGNPLHPYFFGRWQIEDETFRLHLLWAQDWRARFPVLPFGWAAAAALTFLQGTYDAAGETIGLLPFLGVGLFALAARPLDRGTLWLAAATGLLWLGWVHGGGGIYRYLAPFYPAAVLLAGSLLARLPGIPDRWIARGLLIGLAAHLPPLIAVHGRPPGAASVLLGCETDTDFLNRALPPSGHRLGALLRASQAARPGRWLSVGDPQAYYATAPVVTEFEFAPPLIDRLALDSPDARRMRLRLRQRGIRAALVRVEGLVSHARMSGVTPAGAALARVQAFWRDWADPVWTDESVPLNRYLHLYIFRDHPGPFRLPASELRYTPPGTQLLTMEADLLLDAGRFRDALAAARDLTRREPDFVGGWQRMHASAPGAGDRAAERLAAGRLAALGFGSLVRSR